METTTYDYNYSDGPDTHVEPCYRDSDNKLGADLSILFYFMFLFSFLGNGVVLAIIHRFEKLTSVTSILLLNLVVSSLIFVSSLPFIGVYMRLSNWIFGNVMCKIVQSVYYLGFYSSGLFLTLLTFDRHLAVVYSLGVSRFRNRSYAIVSCAVVWLVSCLACVREMILHTAFFNNIDNKTYCEEYSDDLALHHQLRAIGFYLQIFLFFLFPLVVIVYCYVRITITVISSRIVTKFKTVRLIFIIVLVFFVSWTPFNIVLLLQDQATTCEGLQKWGYALQVTRNLAYIYYCVSPIFYTFVGRKFQNYFRQMLVKRFPALKRHVSVSQNSGTIMSTKNTPNDL